MNLPAPIRRVPASTARLAALLVLCAACATERAPKHRALDNKLAPFSGSVEAGDLVFVSGRVGPERETFEQEVRSAILSVKAELARAGLGLGDVVSATVYLTDMARYEEANTVYSSLFPAPYPARACVAVVALPGGARYEIQVVASR